MASKCASSPSGGHWPTSQGAQLWWLLALQGWRAVVRGTEECFCCRCCLIRKSRRRIVRLMESHLPFPVYWVKWRPSRGLCTITSLAFWRQSNHCPNHWSLFVWGHMSFLISKGWPGTLGSCPLYHVGKWAAFPISHPAGFSVLSKNL